MTYQPDKITQLLRKYAEHGHAPIWDARGTFWINRTMYAFGMFTTPPRATGVGTGAYADGYHWTQPETRIVVARQDGTTGPNMFPRAYRRHPHSLFRFGQIGDRVNGPAVYYIAGWNDNDGVFWLHRASAGQIAGQYEEEPPRMIDATELVFNR